jgi:hypothetical protein
MASDLFQSPDRHMICDINDFDETLPGPWERDVKRLAAGFHIGAQSRGFSSPFVRSLTLASLRAYREAMAEIAGVRAIDVGYVHPHADLVRATLGRPQAAVRVAEQVA